MKSVGAIALGALLLATGVSARTATSTAIETPLKTLVVSGVLYDQTDGDAGFNHWVISQDYTAELDSRDSQAADDFVVPSPGWSIESLDVVYYHGGGSVPQSIHVFFYADAGDLPGALVASRPGQAYTWACCYGTASISLSPPVALEPGNYWVSVQAEQGVGGGYWYWGNRLSSTNDPAVWRNPGGGFPLYFCTSTTWTARQSCWDDELGPDQIFRLRGELAGLNILIVYSDFGSPPATLQSALAALPHVASVTVLDGQAGTPAPATFALYQLVVVMSSYYLADDSLLGDRLADYVDGGGRVV